MKKLKHLFLIRMILKIVLALVLTATVSLALYATLRYVTTNQEIQDFTPEISTNVSFAPIMIAASDATAAEKANALASGGYVCDGTRDDVDLLAAIAKLPSGGLVQLSSGTFNVGNGPDTYSMITTDNITISGCDVTTVLNMNGSIYDKAQNFTIENMQIAGDGGNGNTGRGYIFFYHNASQDTPAETFFNFYGTVRNILFTGTGTSSIACILVYGPTAQLSSYFTIDNCTALNTSCRLVCFIAYGGASATFSQVKILNCNVIGCGLTTRSSNYEGGFDLIEGIDLPPTVVPLTELV